MIRANCRNRFRAEDFDFIVRTLARSSSEATSLTELLTDEEARDAILDQEILAHALLSQEAQLSISPQFYFYILLRHVLKKTAISDRAVCDYLASLLEEFSCAARIRPPGTAPGNSSEYLSDMLLALRGASPWQEFHIRAHVGNYSLFLSGIFPERVSERSKRGAPDFSFYEGMGSASYRVAAQHNLARTCNLTGIYETLAEAFHEIRLALNRVADSLFHLDEPAPAILFT
jgi:hypothetical protein